MHRLSGREINFFFSDSHLAPKWPIQKKLVAIFNNNNNNNNNLFTSIAPFNI